MELPESFTEQMQLLLKDEYAAYINSYDNKRAYGLRVNTSKISVEAFERICPFPIERIPWILNGFYYSGEINPAKHPYYYAGLYYIQEPSAMTPAELLEIKPGDRVLDLCAAPGGKATELGSRLLGSGLLLANDISNSRAKGLLKNLELFGLPNIYVTSETPEKLTAYFKNYFDKILVDAPCSGEGMFRKDKNLIKSYREKGPQVYSSIQKEIILQAASMLRPGGKLLYSTCTFSPLENEMTIQHLLDSNKEISLIETKQYHGFSQGRADLAGDYTPLLKCVRIYPHKMDGEGHFIALLEKNTEDKESHSTYKQTASKNSSKLFMCKELEAFLKDIKRDIDKESIIEIDGQIYLLPERLPIMKGLRFLRTGLYLGEIKNSRFIPSQALAMSLKKEDYAAYIDFSSNDNRTVKYLKGETVDISDMPLGAQSGYVLVCTDGFPLGWAKINGSSLKNKYSTGWRWQ